jgi:redox-sensing transcriptional repressor
VAELRAEIGHILGIDNGHRIIVIGAGHLGHALLQNFDFEKVGFQIDSAFDVSDAMIGTTIRNISIRSMDELDAYVAQYRPDVAVLTVPQNVAQPLADRLIDLGIRGFWNFTNVELNTQVPGVFFENVHFVDTLLTLSYRISRV